MLFKIQREFLSHFHMLAPYYNGNQVESDPLALKSMIIQNQ